MVKITDFRNKALIRYRKYFHDNGFFLIPPKDAPTGFEQWIKGFLLKNDQGRVSEHHISVLFDEKFPYSYPVVFTNDDEHFIKASRHQNFHSGKSLICLWHENEWDVFTTPEVFYERLKEWFQRSISNQWKENDLLADLDRHFEQNFIPAITGNGWEKFNFYKFGYFSYMEIKDNNDIQCLYASNPQMGLARNGQYIPLSTKSKECNEPVLKELCKSKKDSIKPHSGLWFYLNAEPKPCRSYNELILQIKKLSGVTKSIINKEINNIKKFSPSSYLVLSLVYKDKKKKNQWIHFQINKSDLKICSFKTCKCDDDSLNMRISHLKTKVQDKSVAIFGMGAIGSVVAESLGKHGLKKIKLVDKGDKLEPSNVLRHSLGIDFVGIDKALAMKQHISKHSLGFTEVLNYNNIKNDVKTIMKIIEDVDIVIDCTANRNFSLLLNHNCIHLNKTYVNIISQRKAAIGKILVVRPHEDPCLCCYQSKDGIIDNHNENDYPFIPKGDDDEMLLGCGDVTYPAVASDIELIATWGVKIILWILQNKFEHNYCLIVNDIIDDAPDYLKEIGHEFRKFEKIKGCEICDK